MKIDELVKPKPEPKRKKSPKKPAFMEFLMPTNKEITMSAAYGGQA